MQYVYAPGCALMSYKPHLAENLKEYVVKRYGEMETFLTCCFDGPEFQEGTCIVTPCATCAINYVKKKPGCTSVFFLEELARMEDFPFPDYGGARMSIQDTCASRAKPEYLAAVRTLLQKMKIELLEPAKSGARAKCCGQVFYGKLENEKVAEKMKERAQEMPCEEVVTYCPSCIMSMTVGGRRPRFILDLLFGEPTSLNMNDIPGWNKTLKEFRLAHPQVLK